jgi:Ribonucleotide reductase, barrel domain
MCNAAIVGCLSTTYTTAMQLIKTDQSVTSNQFVNLTHVYHLAMPLVEHNVFHYHHTDNNCNSPDEVAVCNLASINLSAMVTDGVFDFQRLYTISKVVCKNLNKVIGEYNMMYYYSTDFTITAYSVILYDSSITLTSVVGYAIETTPNTAT